MRAADAVDHTFTYTLYVNVVTLARAATTFGLNATILSRACSWSMRHNIRAAMVKSRCGREKHNIALNASAAPHDCEAETGWWWRQNMQMFVWRLSFLCASGVVNYCTLMRV